MFKSNKRFIAGAVCPKCKAQDRLVMYREDETNYRECIECGFKDEMHIHSAGGELETRVNRTEEEKRSAVQIIDLSGLKK